MAKTNTKTKAPKITKVTHEGAKAANIDAVQELTRSVMACLLWEDSFYESGISISDRISSLIAKINTPTVLNIAKATKNDMKLRHVPLYMLIEAIAKRDGLVTSNDVVALINRPDDLTELLSLYWKKNGKDKPIAATLKKGLAKGFLNFDAYQLAKYQNKGDIKLRDVMFLCHPKPASGMEETYTKLANKTLESPDTWEVQLSGGADKRATFERLIKENKLGSLALLRNIRNMDQSGVSSSIIEKALESANYDRILPYQFISAAVHNPKYESQIEKAMLNSLGKFEKFSGKTVLLIDNSGSMYGATVSAKSELQRIDAACGLAIIGRELCEDVEIVVFGSTAGTIANRRGFALRDLIKLSQHNGGTEMGNAVNLAKTLKPDRMIVFTDEQSSDNVTSRLGCKGYTINVASYQNGVGYGGNWTNITGFSENIFRYIQEYEKFMAK